MTLMRRIVTEKRLPVTVVAVALAVDLGLYAFAIYPGTIRVANAEQRAETAALALTTARQGFAAARTTAAGKAQADEELQKFYIDVLPRDLAGARGITYPRLAARARESNLVMERRSSTPDQEDEGQLARLRTTMTLGGAYRDIRRFIYALETSPEFIVIEEVVLSQGEETDSDLVLTLGVSTFYWAATASDAG